MTIDTKPLRELAKAAIIASESDPVDIAAIRRYTTHASPDVVIGLLDEIDRLREQLEMVRELKCQSCGGTKHFGGAEWGPDCWECRDSANKPTGKRVPELPGGGTDYTKGDGLSQRRVPELEQEDKS